MAVGILYSNETSRENVAIYLEAALFPEDYASLFTKDSDIPAILAKRKFSTSYLTSDLVQYVKNVREHHMK